VCDDGGGSRLAPRIVGAPARAATGGAHAGSVHDGPEAHAHDALAPRESAAGARTVWLEADLLAKNERMAAANREWFARWGVLVLNLVSSPGAGKTTLLERTLRDLGGAWPWAVIEGDQQTDNDARRIAACGVPVVQINTGTMCHLDAQMVADACRQLHPAPGSVVLVENVGNLICPALFDLGEAARVVVASVAEGDDKPAKYPYMFETADLVLLNKWDLRPYVPFDPARFEACLQGVNPHAPVLRVSATGGGGLPAWYAWLAESRAAVGARA
jgi:hydrogenase nickel incorporation protein HypB